MALPMASTQGHLLNLTIQNASRYVANIVSLYHCFGKTFAIGIFIVTPDNSLMLKDAFI